MNLSALISVIQSSPTPRPRTPEDVIEDLQRANRDARGKHHGIIAASRKYTPDEFIFLQKLKGGTPHERAFAELKEMMKEDLKRALQQFIGQHGTAVVERQIEAAKHQIQTTYDEVFRRLGITERIQLEVTMNP